MSHFGGNLLLTAVPAPAIAICLKSLLPHVMKEFATCSTDAQVVYNQMLLDARNVIECAYGTLKARWPILSVPLTFKLQEVPVIIIMYFVLHNWCEQHNVAIHDTAVNDQIQEDREMQLSRTTGRQYSANNYYKRLISGLSSAPEMYQYVIQQTLQGIPRVRNISDDLTVFGSD